MKAYLSLLALIGTALAGNVARWNQGGGGEHGYPTITKTTEVDVTYTTTCPVTETVKKPGTTYTTTYTTTSVCYTKVITTIYETVKGPDVTKTQEDVAYTTITSLCPITETKTIGGSTVCITWTSTSTIVKQVPTYVPVYVTSVTTEYATTDVYVTTTCPVETYTTIIAGSTVCITETHTKTITVSSAYTVTEVIPVTKTVDVDVTVDVTVGGGATVTQESLTVVTIGGTVFETSVAPPGTTIIVPTTSTASSAPVTVATAGANAAAPTMAFVAGIVGALALF